MAKIHTSTTPYDLKEERPGHYYANVYQHGDMFVKGYYFEMFSGTMVHDEIKDLRRKYSVQEGYRIEW
jgi:hypothetical protein